MGENFERLAEREGLPISFQKFNKIRHYLYTRRRHVYQSYAPKSIKMRPHPTRASRYDAATESCWDTIAGSME